MSKAAAVCVDVILPLSGVDSKFAHLSDQELLASTRRLVGATNQILAELLTHLAEVEARGIHRARLCTSLYTYCVYELRFSEDAAFRRVSAARLVQRFPMLYDAIASGELHLTGLLMLGPHLTAENISEVLPRAKHRTKKELAKLLRQLDPLPDVPARIVPLGPETQLQSKPRKPTYAEYVGSLNPVNHLPSGDRPRDWMSEPPFGLVTETEQVVGGAPARRAQRSHETAINDPVSLPAPARLETLAPLAGPQRYQVQFTAGQEYVDLVERAQALLSHTSGGGLAELHLRALRGLVAELEKRKYAVTHSSNDAVLPSVKHPPGESEGALVHAGAGAGAHAGAHAEARAGADVEAQAEAAAQADVGAQAGARSELAEQAASALAEAQAENPSGAESDAEVEARAAGKLGAESRDLFGAGAANDAKPSRWRGRYIPAAVRRAVIARDGQRCAYMDEEGRRCPETHRLEFHHIVAFALRGAHSLHNISVRCQCHNLLAAEDDFGREAMRQARERQAHESLSKQVAFARERRG